MDIDSILGNYKTRYFGNGYKNTDYDIKMIKPNLFSAKISMNGKVWSLKNNKEMRQYLSTLDGIILASLTVEKILINKVLDEYWISHFKIKAGKHAIESMDNVLIKFNRMKVDTNYYLFKFNIEGMKIDLKIEKNHGDKKARTDSVSMEPYTTGHLKDSTLYIDNISYLDKDGLSACVTKKVKNMSYCGLGSVASNSISLLEWLVVFSQIGEVMTYHHDNMERCDSNNLWMKMITADLKEGTASTINRRVVSEITKSSLVNMHDDRWRIITAKGSDIDNKVLITAKIAHQLPEEKQK